jgi:preprotein translocase subunit SecG
LFTAMIIFHTIVCVLLVIVVLMQSAKGEGLAGAFGGGGTGLSGAVFGGRGAASFLSKATTVLAIIFMLNCGVLAYMSANRTGGGSAIGTTESAVTREAQRELERQAAQRQVIPPQEGETPGQLPPSDVQPSETPSSGGGN